MRASLVFGEFHGRMYECVGFPGPDVRLYELGTAPCPDGFVLDRWGRWTRLVDLADLSRVVQVETTATWRGHRVEVEGVKGDQVVVRRYEWPPPGEPEVHHENDGWWRAEVTGSELSDVTESERALTPPGE